MHTVGSCERLRNADRLGLGYGGATSLNTNITLQDIDGNAPADTDTKDTSGPKMGLHLTGTQVSFPTANTLFGRYADRRNDGGWNGMSTTARKVHDFLLQIAGGLNSIGPVYG